MKKYFFLIIVVLCAFPLFSRDYFFMLTSEEDISGETIERRTLPVLDKNMDDPGNERATLKFYEYKKGNDVSPYFIISYSGEEWRFYDTLLLNVDGTVFTLEKTFDDNDVYSWGWVSEEAYFEISTEILASLKEAKTIKVQMRGDKYRHSVVTLPDEAVMAVRLFASRDFDQLSTNVPDVYLP
jgi:hypothetical protein